MQGPCPASDASNIKSEEAVEAPFFRVETLAKDDERLVRNQVHTAIGVVVPCSGWLSQGELLGGLMDA